MRCLPCRLILILVMISAVACRDELVQPSQPQRPQFSQVSPRVTITDLGTLGGNFSQPVAINARGQVIGFSTTADGDWRGFLWDTGTMQDLGKVSLVGINDAGQIAGGGGALLWEHGAWRDLGAPPGCTSSWATAINASGQVIGVAACPSGHGFLWDGKTMQDLGSFTPTAINDGGEIVGTDAQEHPVIWKSGVLRDLPMPDDRALEVWGLTINARGQVGGQWLGLGTGPHAFLWDGAAMHNIPLVPGDDWEGDPSRWGSSVVGLNVRGQVAGISSGGEYAGQQLTFLWERDRIQSLGTLGGTDSRPFAINNRGDVVGQSALAGNWCYIDYPPACHGFLWDGSTMLDLGSLGGASVAVALNNNRQVVGWSALSTDNPLRWSSPIHAVLWSVTP